MLKITLVLLALGIGSSALACDEQCKREKLATEKKVVFPNHLSLKYCQSVASEFLLNTRKSLGTYHERQLPTAHRGGARNIKNFIVSRKDWLDECDNYMTTLDYGSIFRKKDATAQMLKALTDTASELDKLSKIPAATGENASELTQPAAEKFSQLFVLMDANLIELQKRGVL